MHHHHHHAADMEAIRASKAKVHAALQEHLACVYGEDVGILRDWLVYNEVVDMDADPNIIVAFSEHSMPHFWRGTAYVGMQIVNDMTDDCCG